MRRSRARLVVALTTVFALGLFGSSAQAGVGVEGPDGQLLQDVVRVIPQPELDGVQQESILITRSEPLSRLTPTFNPLQPLMSMASDTYEYQNLEGVGTWEDWVTRPTAVAACSSDIYQVVRWHVPEPSVATWWQMLCNTDVAFGLNSCIFRGRWPNPKQMMGCNRPRGLHVQAGFWVSGQTTTRCSDSTWYYFQYLWIMTNIGAGGGAGPGRYQSC